MNAATACPRACSTPTNGMPSRRGQGDAESKSRLAVLATQLSDDDRAAAQKSAATFHAAPLNRAANVPPEMADLSGN